VVHERTQDLAMSQAQHDEMMASLPAALAKATALKVSNNIAKFGATIPSYLASEVVGPPVVPCYVGWYFSVVLGNGTVLPCAQCTAPIGQVTKDRSFAEVWASGEYAEFRTAAKALPEKHMRLETAECDNCQLRARNVAIHNFLHPLGRIEAGDEVEKFTARDFVRKMQGRLGIQSNT
jgi:radical SAM protein with 4Fe4S-binding SPASM domain